MFITAEDLVYRLRFFGNPDSIELIGENKQFGKLVCKLGNNTKEIGIYIHDEDRIMEVIVEVLCRFNQIWTVNCNK